MAVLVYSLFVRSLARLLARLYARFCFVLVPYLLPRYDNDTVIQEG